MERVAREISSILFKGSVDYFGIVMFIDSQEFLLNHYYLLLLQSLIGVSFRVIVRNLRATAHVI